MANHQVSVKPVRDSNGQFVEWELCYRKSPNASAQCGGPGDYPVIYLPWRTNAQNITFTIDDPTDTITFSEDPIWLQANAKPQGPGVDNNHITIVSKAAKKLILHDTNEGSPVTYKYALNFIGAPRLDPDIRNGGTNFYGLSDTLVLVGAVMLTLVIGFFLGRSKILRAKGSTN